MTQNRSLSALAREASLRFLRLKSYRDSGGPGGRDAHRPAGPPMANERKTENLIRDALKKLGYYAMSKPIRVEEQKSEIEGVKRLLKTASKTGKGGMGSPEFIVSSTSDPDFLVIIECKADTKDHQSKTGTSPQKFAVDGALHYAKFLSKEYNVIAVAASGSTKATLKLSTFLHPKGGAAPQDLKTKTGAAIAGLIPWHDYIEHATFDPSIQKLRHDELMAFASDLHIFMRDYAKLTESEKPLLVSGTLMALRDKAFAKSFDAHAPEDLQKEWQKVIADQLNKADLPQAKKVSLTQPYSTIAVHPELGKATTKYPKGVMYELIRMLNEKVWPFISVYHDFDVVGQFYGEFLRYTGGDKKALGIVLTPRHLTELFALLANVKKDSTVLDICAGTGGFLISAMHQMMRGATTDAQKKRIQQKGLIGVEQQPNMYALAASNMILRGDGKANLFQGSCFTEAVVADIKKFHCDVGLLNPPYSQGDADLHELVFVKHMLDCLDKGGVGIAVVPISCAISPHEMREALMKAHTLEAVMSLPPEIFYPVGVVTCAMVWTAGIPHAESNKKTWFGYWRDDGYIKTKHKGRIDLYGKWAAIRESWVEGFRNREIKAGKSVARKVTAADEWCAEAYMETDYSTLTRSDFERELRKYLVFQILNDPTLEAEHGDEEVE